MIVRVFLLLTLTALCMAADLTSEAELKKFRDSKNYEGGVAAYTRELASRPADAALLTSFGILHYSSAKYSEAAAALEQALRIDPKQANAHNFLGWCDRNKAGRSRRWNIWNWRSSPIRTTPTRTSISRSSTPRAGHPTSLRLGLPTSAHAASALALTPRWKP